MIDLEQTKIRRAEALTNLLWDENSDENIEKVIDEKKNHPKYKRLIERYRKLEVQEKQMKIKLNNSKKVKEASPDTWAQLYMGPRARLEKEKSNIRLQIAEMYVNEIPPVEV